MSKALTKSRFKAAYECPRKLYYGEHREYGNTVRESDFMKALAEGGFQVGALSKLYIPGGEDLEHLKSVEAEKVTSELLKREEVIIYEAAIAVDGYLIRVDILRKNGSNVELIEVKAKSHDFEKDTFFSKVKGDPSNPKRGSTLQSKWEPYLMDVAFQTYVFRRAFPKLNVKPYLYVVDKRVKVEHEGLHQCFLVKKENGRPKIITSGEIDKNLLSPPILSLVSVGVEVEFILAEEVFSKPEPVEFSEYTKFLIQLLGADKPGPVRANELCKSCEYKISPPLEKLGYKNGFKQCWTEAALLDEESRDKETVFELWDNRRAKRHLEDGIVFLADLTKNDLGEDKDSEIGLSRVGRQWLQIEKHISKDSSPYFDFDYLAEFFSKLRYPLHFIDFETTRVAIPFHVQQRPYEQIAYQFSHHLMHSDGRIEHKSQYIHTSPGMFPNFEFAQALMDTLGSDEGTVFRYSHHENTTLNEIIEQLTTHKPKDFDKLAGFLETITKKGKGDELGSRRGSRSMVDLCEVVKKSVYLASMRGSNSIKVVTPAILSYSKRLQEKYTKAIYGKGLEINSLNFEKRVWVEFDKNGNISDPYKSLPVIELDEGFRLTDMEAINEGGGASVAWARMQFTEMSSEERKAIADALLRYCELDTLSMVWLFEFIREAFESKDKN